MGIAIDAMKLADKLDVVCLVTGDGDFKDLVNHLKANGVRVEVMGFDESTAKELKDTATNFIDMSESKNYFLM